MGRGVGQCRAAETRHSSKRRYNIPGTGCDRVETRCTEVGGVLTQQLLARRTVQMRGIQRHPNAPRRRVGKLRGLEIRVYAATQRRNREVWIPLEMFAHGIVSALCQPGAVE